MRLLRPLKVMIALALAMASSPAAWACASCFGKSDSALARGMNMGIFVLLGFIGTVLAGIAGVGVYFAMRASRVRAQEAQRETDSVPNV